MDNPIIRIMLVATVIMVGFAVVAIMLSRSCVV